MSFLLRRTRNNRLLDIVVFMAIVMAILAVLRFLPEAEPVVVSGRASVIDGDSIVVRGVEIRLLGVDAPERDQMCTRNGAEWPCGTRASENLRNQLHGKIVTCSGNERDVHDRLLAICKVHDSDLNRLLVREGWAVSYGRYFDEERAAKKTRRGIWSGSFVQPRDWRDGNR